MNKLVYSALAMTLCSVPGLASDNWSALDQELNSLSASLAAQNQGGPKVGGWVISSFRASGDDALAVGGEDLQGFQIDSARIEVSGDAGQDYSYKVSLDLETGVAEIKDAYAKWLIAEGVYGKLGRYKIAFLQSSLCSETKLLFLERSALGEVFSDRDIGLEFSGEFDTVEWWAGVRNGIDDQADEHEFSARIRANLMGNGTARQEGAFGSGDETNLSAGVSWMDDGAIEDGMILGVEAQLTAGPFSITGEVVDFDDDAAGFGVTNPILELYGITTGGDVADTTPWSVTGSFMFTEMYEAAVRYEDADDVDDTTQIKVAINRYVHGHDIKWQAQYSHVDTENAVDDFDALGVGLVVAF